MALPTDKIGSGEGPDVLPLTIEEEDALIHLRILSDERALRKVIKKFHSYVFTGESGGDMENGISPEMSPDEAREGLFAELATFQATLQKSAMVCQAEARQVVEYENEKERIAREHDVTRKEIAKLKVSLEEAQLFRKRKIEYDQVAEKVNLLPSRTELQSSIASIQEEIAAIQVELEHKARMMHARKIALDQIVSSLEALRQLDREPEVQVVMDDDPMDTNAREGTAEEEGQQREDRENDRRDREREREARDQEDDGHESEEAQVADSILNPTAKSFLPRGPLGRLRDGDHGSPASSVPPSNMPSPSPHKAEEGEEGEEHEDIEMGEVSEATSQSQPPNGRTKRRQQEELEEGEASDGSSAVTEPPAN